MAEIQASKINGGEMAATLENVHVYSQIKNPNGNFVQEFKGTIIPSLLFIFPPCVEIFEMIAMKIQKKCRKRAITPILDEEFSQKLINR